MEFRTPLQIHQTLLSCVHFFLTGRSYPTQHHCSCRQASDLRPPSSGGSQSAESATSERPTFSRSNLLPSKIDLLLGEDIIHRILLPDVRVGECDHTPIAWKTVFGCQGQPHRAVTHVNMPTVVDSTKKLLTRFWETEEQPSQELPLTPEGKSIIIVLICFFPM